MAKKTTTGKPVKAEELTADRIPMKTAANPSQQTKKTISIPKNFEQRMAEKGFQKTYVNGQERYYAPGTYKAKGIKKLEDQGFTQKPSGVYTKDYVHK